jgi:pimeloyl-ACP methyl ester carboxylesterase
MKPPDAKFAHMLRRLCAAALLLAAAGAATAADGLRPCRIKGLKNEVQCGSILRPLDPARPQGLQIAVHYVVLPALARNKQPDALFFFAGGPGQSAIKLAPVVGPLFSRLNNRRDIVLIDQRGTGDSAPLDCKDGDDARLPLAEQFDPARLPARMAQCLRELQRLPYGDLRFFTTTIAMQDADAVRAKLGYERINVAGGSYGTRAVLEYLRVFPQHVRRAYIDGVAPPDMALPRSFSPDAQAAFDALLDACEHDAACARRYPQLRAQWKALLASLPKDVTVTRPATGLPETLRFSRDMLTGLARGPLYGPGIAAALPFALSEAAQGRFTPLVGLTTALAGGESTRLAWGMHFSVICAEDYPRIGSSGEPPGADFGDGFAALYAGVCAAWPRGEVPAAFYTLPAAQSPVLVTSGGLDPVTPPRHGERVARALGAQARHVVVPHAGHGVMAIGCMRDVLARYFDAKTDAEALAVDAACVQAIPRPSFYLPPQPQAAR